MDIQKKHKSGAPPRKESHDFFSQLPMDLLVNVFLMVSPCEVQCCSRVCQSWRESTKGDFLWRCHAERRWKHLNTHLFPKDLSDEKSNSSRTAENTVSWRDLYFHDNGWAHEMNEVKCLNISDAPTRRERKAQGRIGDCFADGRQIAIVQQPRRFCDHRKRWVQHHQSNLLLFDENFDEYLNYQCDTSLKKITFTDEHIICLTEHQTFQIFPREGNAATFTEKCITPDYQVVECEYRAFMFAKYNMLYLHEFTDAMGLIDLNTWIGEYVYYGARVVCADTVDETSFLTGVTGQGSFSEIYLTDLRIPHTGDSFSTHKRLQSIHVSSPYVYTAHFGTNVEKWDLRNFSRCVHSFKGTGGTGLLDGNDDVVVGYRTNPQLKMVDKQLWKINKCRENEPVKNMFTSMYDTSPWGTKMMLTRPDTVVMCDENSFSVRRLSCLENAGV